ncbi:MAG: MFS transporter, partial [Chloroflexi bacterium]|nr:MFS transporter [Chloroflexota bacterium]
MTNSDSSHSDSVISPDVKTANTDKLERHTSALSFKPFRIYFGGTVLAMNALRLGAVAQGLLMWDLTGSPLSLGGVAAATAIPMMLVNIFGGVFADRYEAKFLLGGSSLIGAVLFVLLGVLDITETVQPWHIFSIAIFSGLVSGADQPSRQAYFPSLVPKSAMKSAITINGSLMASASVVAPTVGGLLMAAFGTPFGFFIASLGWFAMFVATLVLPRRGRTVVQKSVLRDLGTGIGYIKHHRVMLVLLVLSFSNMLMVFGWIGMLPAYVELFNGGKREVGFMFSSAGIGAFSGIMLAGRLSPGRHLGWLILAGAMSFSAIMFVVSNSPSLGLAMPLAALAHFGNGLFNISALVAVQLRVPEDIRGRVMGVFAISQSVGILGGLWTGTLATVIGLRAGMMIGPAIMLIMIVTIFITQRKVRNLHEDPVYDR